MKKAALICIKVIEPWNSFVTKNRKNRGRATSEEEMKFAFQGKN